MSSQYIFVYGSLKRGFPLERYLVGCEFISPGKLEGASLLNLGAYPALILCRPSTGVLGEIYKLGGATLLTMLDAVENEGLMYKRVQMEVHTPPAEKLTCWVYVYMPMIKQEFVENGNWEGGA